MSVLEPLGAVRPDYRHEDKEVRPSESLMLDEALLKWYDVAPGDAPVPGAVRALARRTLRAAAKAGTIELRGELGFVVLHRCGEGFSFLLVCTWRNDNELWETVWAQERRGGSRLPPVARRGDAPPDVLRLGARRGLPRAAGVDPVSALGPRRSGEARVPAGDLRRALLRRGVGTFRASRPPPAASPRPSVLGGRRVV